MTDHSELKRLAEAATPGPWYQHGGIMQVLSHDCETVCETFEDDGECPDAQFIAAANPAAVLALIAENEQLAKTADCWDRLNVQNKALSDSFRAERDQAEQDYKDVVGTIELRDIEISKLRAEVAGLRTGYEAYEQVNAELKAENERLERNRDMWKGQVERQTEELRLAHEADKLLKSECEGLRESLTHAADEVESWGAYASDYFQQKHDLAGTVLKVRQAAVSKESGQ